jgi:signal peptidase I
LVGLLYLFANLATIAVCGSAVMSFSRPVFAMAGFMLAVVLILYIVEVISVSKAKVHERHQNRLRTAFVPIAVAQLALALVFAVLLFGTSGSIRMQGSGMSPELRPGERLIYRKTVQTSDLRTGSLILYRLNPENTWINRRLLVTARILATPGDRIAQRDGRYIVNGRETVQTVGSVGRYKRAIAVPDAPDTLAVPDGCFFIAQDNPEKSFDSQVLAWARRADVVSTDIRHLVKDGEFLKKAE